MFCVIFILSSLVTTVILSVKSRELQNENKTNVHEVISDDDSAVKRGPNGSEWRIIGGKDCSTNEYPFMVSFRRVKLSDHLCGGSLLAQRWVLTCAYRFEAIVDKPELVKALVGHSVFRQGRILAQERQIQKIILHPNFELKVMRNDIALVYLTRRVTVFIDFFDKHFLKIPARSLPDDLSKECSPDSFIAAGWGDVRPYGSNDNPPIMQPSPQLKCVNLHYLTREKCLQYSIFYANTDKILCTLVPGGGKDVCDGDYGGPLFCNGIQYGIASWAHGCGAPDSPTFFTRVDRYLDFIHESMREEPKGIGNREGIPHYFLLVLFIFTV